MIFLKIIKQFFKKSPKKTPVLSEFEIGLKKWDDLGWVHITFISEIINNCNLNDLAVALIHCKKPIFNIFLQTAKALFHTTLLTSSVGDDLEKLLIKHKNVTKNQSNKMKAHIANNVLHPDYAKFRNLSYGQSPRID
jgi:hypothetical protein